MRDAGATSLLSSMTEGLIKEKTYKEKIVRVETVIDDGFDEIIDLVSATENNTEEVHSSTQFELSQEESEGENFTAESLGNGILLPKFSDLL